MEKPQRAQLEAFQKAGIEAYRKEDYKAALVHFTAALSYLKSRTVQGIKSYELLNLRAAVYEKMDGKLEEAAKDAKRMIKLDEKSVPGYLRAGKVLGLMGRWEAALGVYRYGLERVPEGDKQREVLMEMCEKVEGKVERMRYDAKRTDPLIILPLELIDFIMLMMDFRSMIRCQRVSKSWRNFLRTYYHIYRKLDFSHAVSAPKAKTIDKYINLSRLPGLAPVEEIIFSRFFTTTDNVLVRKYISECPSLHTLRIPQGVPGTLLGAGCFGDARSLQTLILECGIGIGDVTEILQTCRRLRRLECYIIDISNFRKAIPPWWYEIACPNLETILLRLCQDRAPSRARDMNLILPSMSFSQAMPNLRSIATLDWGPLRIFRDWDFSGFQHLEQFLSHNDFGVPFPRLPQSVTSLTLRGYHIVTQNTASLIDQNPLPNLHTFNLSENRWANNEFISTILSHLPSPSPLRVLNLSQCPCIDATDLGWLLAEGHCDYLEELYLVGVTSFGDQVTKEMGCLGWLKRIDISQTSVTGVGLMNIVNGVGRKRAEKTGREKGVEWVRIVFCEGVGLDAIELARKMGVRVTYLKESLECKARPVWFV